MNRFRKSLFLSIGLLFSVFFLVSPTFSQEPGVVVKEFETPALENMPSLEWLLENAIPYDNAIDTPPQEVPAAELYNALEGDPPVMVPGALPDPNADATARQLFPEAWENTDTDDKMDSIGLDDFYSYEPPHTTNYVHEGGTRGITKFPEKAVGKLFFVKNGTNSWYSCSASVGGRRSIWTAGHCVYVPKQGWNRYFYFYPGLNYRAPYGYFVANAGVVNPYWAYYGYYGHDIAGLRLADRGGRTVSYYTGYLGYAYHVYPAHWHNFGYPSNSYSSPIPWKSNYMAFTAASTSRYEYQGYYTMAMGSWQRPGSSGGPWIWRYKPYHGGSWNYVNGVNSYFYTSKPNQIYSPWFASANYVPQIASYIRGW
jgi:V8-like Glu-specific endopeptidase